jgi:uncharacterized phage-associated protein
MFLNMTLRFSEKRTTQAAARLIKRHGGSLSYMKMLKMLYLADRAALVQLGRPISFDSYVSMPHGPVLSETLNLIKGAPPGSYWRRYISEPAHYNVSLLRQAPKSQLSVAEEKILDRIYAQFGALSKWTVRDYTHTLPEWKDPGDSSLPLPYEDVLRGADVSEEDAEAILDDLRAEASLAGLDD